MNSSKTARFVKVLVFALLLLSASSTLLFAQTGTSSETANKREAGSDTSREPSSTVDLNESSSEDSPPDSEVLQKDDLPALPEPDAIEAEVLTKPSKKPRVVRPPPKPKPRENTREIVTEAKLEEYLERRGELLRVGDLTGADSEIALIEEVRQELVVRNVIVASTQLIYEARTAIELGRLDRAVSLANASARLSPDLEAAHWMKILAYTAQDWTQWSRIGKAALSFVQAKLTVFRNQVRALTELVFVTSLAFLFTLVMFSLIQLIRYIRYPAHDLASLGPGFVGTGEAVLTLLILLVLPYVLGWGVVPSLALSLVLLMGYQQIGERIVSVLFLVALATWPLGLKSMSSLVVFPGSVSDAMATATSEALAHSAEARLQDAVKHRKDYASAMVLAHRLRQRGELTGAEAAYQSALRARPNDPRAQNNLGTILFLTARIEGAQAAFLAATRKNDRPEPFLNLASLAEDQGQFQKATAFIESARRIDSELTGRYTKIGAGRRTGDKLLEAPLDTGLLWSSLFENVSKDAAEVEYQLWSPWGGRLEGWMASGLVVLLLLIGLLSMRWTERLSTACPKCGLPARRHVHGTLCEQCRSVFLATEDIEPELRRKKERQIIRYQRGRRWFERILCLCAGAGTIMGGRAIYGVLLLFPFLWVCSAAVFDQIGVAHPWDVYIDTSLIFLRLVFAGVVGGLLVFLSLREVFGR